ncbi:MAG TPA: DsbA family protein [Mycobacteriales bacterium]|jgi:protein-disulfide isomerase|nr:DsbA family protein [Mycobacteriales bacterium]
MSTPYRDYGGAPTQLARPIDPGWDHLQGSPDAPVTLVEYGDYQCPFCGAAHPNVQAVQAAMGDDLLFAFRHFPLVEAHPFAEPAAEAAEAAGAQGLFWEMHDQLFTHQRALEPEYLLLYATTIGLDVDRFATELATRTYAPRVIEHLQSGVASGVQGTPTFFVNGLHYQGSYEAPALLTVLREAAAQRA